MTKDRFLLGKGNGIIMDGRKDVKMGASSGKRETDKIKGQ